MSRTPSIHMGHGQMVDISPRGADAWELAFSEVGVAQYKAPPVADVRVEAIDPDGAIHSLRISPGGNASAILASGMVAKAYRARVMVMHGDHFHTRESLLPGKSDIAAIAGPGGGALVRFGGAEVEARLIAPDQFELAFPAGGGPVAPENVVMQAIGPRAEDYQIRALAVRAGERPGTLVASGKIKDATYLRLTLKSDAGVEIRSVPVVR